MEVDAYEEKAREVAEQTAFILWETGLIKYDDKGRAVECIGAELAAAIREAVEEALEKEREDHADDVRDALERRDF